MTTTVIERHELADAARDYIRALANLVESVCDGINAADSASFVFLQAAKASNASTHFWQTLSRTHCETLNADPDESDDCGRQPYSPAEIAEDFASLAGKLAEEKSQPPISADYIPWAEHRLAATDLGVGRFSSWRR